MDKITLENFRCFREKQTARLAPLTLLVGENSTGKTSFLAMIRALWDIVYGQENPDFKKAPYDLGSFDEIAHYRGGRGGRATTFEAGFHGTTKENEPFRFETTFRKQKTAPVPDRRRLSQKDAWIELNLSQKELCFGTKRGAWKYHLSKHELYSLNVTHYNHLLLFFDSLIRGEALDNSWNALSGAAEPTTQDFEQIRKVIAISESEHLHPDSLYTGAPIRSKPRRTYNPLDHYISIHEDDYNSLYEDDFFPMEDDYILKESEGDYIPMYLSNLYLEDKEHWENIKGGLEKFGQTAGLFDEISVKPVGKKDVGSFQIQIRKFGKRVKGPHRNLMDVGYGVSQALLVVTELLSTDAFMFLLQQPEAHLHPRAQAVLGSVFCLIAAPERQLVVETHSDHLINRVRMDVRDGKGNLKPEDVSILFFERRDLDVHIHSLAIDAEGNILNAPPVYRQFFIDEMERSIWKRQKSKGN